MPTPSSPDVTEAAETPELAVAQMRAGLVERDADRVQAHRWLAPRPPSERDLLSDLAAAQGIGRAVRRLSRFWERANVLLERVRYVDGNEAEVYERVVLPGDTLAIVSVVRRESASAPWKVVCTNESHDDRVSLWLAVPSLTTDEHEWTQIFARSYEDDAAELVIADDDSGVLGHPERGWLANVRLPFVPAEWPENLPGEGDRILEITQSLSERPDERRDQLLWLVRCSSVFAHLLSAHGAYLPLLKKLIPIPALALAAQSELDGPRRFELWARVERVQKHAVTIGLGQLGLPEVEVPDAVAGDRSAAIAKWLGGLIAGGTFAPVPGTELVESQRTLQIVSGRRGPRVGRSYGRWGAVGVGPLDTRDRRGSRTRIRVPDDV
jgi:hypothetical protein